MRNDVDTGQIPWEGPRRGGLLAALRGTWWQFVRSPTEAWVTVPLAGGARRPWTFALACGAIFGVISELIDSWTVALARFGGWIELTDLIQLDIAGRSLEWLPISALSAAGCVVALLVGVPVFVLVYSLLLALWMTSLHVLLRVTGGLAASEAGYQGTLRAVCYSQAALAAAIVPWIGDPIAVLWSCGLQVIGLAHVHRCARRRAAVTVGLLLVAAILLILLLSAFLGIEFQG